VRYVVVVDPGHLGARTDRQLGRIEGEIVDDDVCRGAGFRDFISWPIAIAL
jgi:hypothetical protein